MIKNKIINIKFIFKNIKNMILGFCSTKIKQQFLKIVLNYYFLELFSKTYIKTYF